MTDKRKVFILAAVIFALLCPEARAEGVDCSAACAVVMHSGGETVYEKNADEKSLVASTTKLMTALVTVEECPLTDTAEATWEDCSVEGSSMYLRPGERYTVRQLLEGLLLASGNDAASVLARHVAGDQAAFAELMNRRAAALGMVNSHFVNPHGLNAEGHYSTARDLALLMDRCMSHPVLAEILQMPSAQIKGQTYVNHNKLLTSCDGCIGGKTGYTVAAGRCLVSCCEREGLRFICVTLNDPDDWDDHVRLYDWAFSAFREWDILRGVSFDVPLIGQSEQTARIEPAERPLIFAPTDTEFVLECDMPRFVFPPVAAGERAGEVRAYIAGKPIGAWPLVYMNGE